MNNEILYTYKIIQFLKNNNIDITVDLLFPENYILSTIVKRIQNITNITNEIIYNYLKNTNSNEIKDIKKEIELKRLELLKK